MTTTTEAKSEAPKQRSYFVKDTVNRYILDDGESFIEHTKLDEGLFQMYQDITSKIKLDADGSSTEVDMKLGEQRKFLLENLVTGWNMIDENGDAIKFTPTRLKELPPHVISGLIQDIYSKNEILSGETESGKEKRNKS